MTAVVPAASKVIAVLGMVIWGREVPSGRCKVTTELPKAWAEEVVDVTVMSSSVMPASPWLMDWKTRMSVPFATRGIEMRFQIGVALDAYWRVSMAIPFQRICVIITGAGLRDRLL